MSELSERDAVLCSRDGTDDPAHAAFQTIYTRYFADVYRFEQSLLRDADSTQDAVQETFVRLLHGLKGFDPDRPLRPYLFSIARNVAIDVLRARQKRPGTLEKDQAQAPTETVVDAASLSERRAAVEQALAALAPEHRSILVLRHVQGLELAEIADGASCTVRTIRNRLRAAGALLGRELKRRGVVGNEVPS